MGELIRADYYNQKAYSKIRFSTTEIAKEYAMSARKLNNILHQEKVQFMRGGVWVLYPEYAGRCYTTTKPIPFKNTRGNYTRMRFKSRFWTEVGREFIYNILKERRGLVPETESEGI